MYASEYSIRHSPWRRSRLKYLALSAALLLACAPVYAQNLPFEHLLGNKDHDIGAIKALAQDPMGFVWLGAEYGLARYDGAQATRYYVNPDDPHSLLSNYINDLLVDEDGVLWIATEIGLNRYRSRTDDFEQYRPAPSGDNNRVAALAVDQENRLILAVDDGITVFDAEHNEFNPIWLPQPERTRNVSVQTVTVDRSNRVWIGTRGAGAAIVDLDTQTFTFFGHDPKVPNSIVHDDISVITQDHQGRIWFGSNTNGLSRFDPKAQTFSNFRHDSRNPDTIGSNAIWDIYVDSKGLVWIATDPGGLALYNEQEDRFQHWRHNSYAADGISSSTIRKIMEDADGDLWVGVFPYGLNYVNRAAAEFKNYRHRPDQPKSLSHRAILDFFEDSDGLLWVGTENGLNAFDRDRQEFTRYVRNANVEHALKADSILSIAEDDHGNLWVGTWSGGAHRFDKESQHFHQYAPDPNDPTSLSNAFVWSIIHDREGRLWLGTEGGGLNLYDPDTDSFRHFQYDPNIPTTIDSNFIWSMLEDSRGHLWVGTSAGLNRFDPSTERFTHFAKQSDSPQAFNSDRVRSFMEDSQGQIWIGTQDNGFFIYDPSSETFTQPIPRTRLPAAFVTGFVEDKLGSVWVTTTSGVARVDPTTMTMRTFTVHHGLIANNFNREANFLDSEGRVYLGSSEGFSVFDPSHIQEENLDRTILFTGFNIFNEPAVIAEDSPLKAAIWHTQEIVLNHEQTMFTLEFSALSYRNRKNTLYAYKLEGFDRQWNNIGTSNAATFTNLSPGTYTLKVKSGNNDGWSENISTLNVRILPPPWRTFWAYGLYVGFFGGFIVLLVHAKIRRLELRSERATNQELLNLNSIKDAFLANTSHELRTPLNGIIGIADSLAEELAETNDSAAHRLNLIASSGKRLANLINDILDYSKLGNRNLELRLQSINMQAITETVFTLLAPLTVPKAITLKHTLDKNTPLVMADENRLQQILINLIGNGIKYSNGGSVTVSLLTEGKYAEICVADTGIGIAPKDREAIFEGFNQLQSNNAGQSGGTGLGLAITKQLVQLHGGTIRAESRVGKGSQFYFTLPLDAENNFSTPQSTPASEDDAQASETSIQNLPHAVSQKGLEKAIDKLPSNLTKPRNAEDQTLLIVDDDAVNRIVLSGILALHEYSILEAGSGSEAIEILAANPQIDLVIMDVMMPDMSGFETCAIIRETYAIHELPILFLTAKKNVDEDIAQCFSVGGNDYFTKPVVKADLLPRVANHLRILNVVRKLQLDLGRTHASTANQTQKTTPEEPKKAT